MSETFQDELNRLDPYLSCDWNRDGGYWEIFRKPRVPQFFGEFDGVHYMEVRPMPFHILTVKKSNLATMDWRVIYRLREIDLWRRYGDNLKQYHIDCENRVAEHNERRRKHDLKGLIDDTKNCRAGMRGIKENLKAGLDPFATEKKIKGRKHFSFTGQDAHGYKGDGYEIVERWS